MDSVGLCFTGAASISSERAGDVRSHGDTQSKRKGGEESETILDVDTCTFFQSDLTWPRVGAHATETSSHVSQVGTESDPVAGIEEQCSMSVIEIHIHFQTKPQH